jgi:carbonyl reductase 1
LTSRDKSRGEEALKSIESDAQLKDTKVLVADGGVVDVQHHTLDISETKSIQNFAEFLKEEHPQGIDFVINNAGIAMNGFGEFLWLFCVTNWVRHR